MRLGIVGGALQGMEIAYLARKAGFETVVIDRWDRAPAFSLADEHMIMDAVKDRPAIAALKGCDAVIPANEEFDTLKRLCTLMRDGPPLIFDLQAYRVSRSKVLSNKLFRTLNVPMPTPWPESGFPVIVKPSEESGSVGVSRANNEVQLRKGIEKARTHGEGIVIQEFVSGPSVSLEIIGNGEEYVPLVTTEVHFDEGYDCKMVTSPSGDAAFDDGIFRSSTERVAASLGLKGIMDMEAMVSKGIPKLIEIDARFPSQTPTAAYHSTGVNMVDMLVKAFTEGHLDRPDTRAPRSVIYEHVFVEDSVLTSHGEGRLVDHEGMRVCPGLFGADEVITDRWKGADRWAATIICTGKDHKEARKKRRGVLRSIMKEHDLRSHSDPVPEARTA